jgi:aminomethyltransferase
MVEFAGWEMPLHYGSQIEEHHRVRRGAGLFDVSHMLALDVLGEGARAFLARLLANDVTRLAAPGSALYSCMLDHDGGVLDDLLAYFLEPGRYRLVVNAATAERDRAWIEARRDELAPEVEVVARRDLAILAVQGPEARARTWAARPLVRSASEALAPFRAAETEGMLIARTGYTGEDGFEIMLEASGAPRLWRDLTAAGIAPAGLGARDTLRLEAGMNLYGQDMDETTTPFEAGLGWTVRLEGGREFIGRRALEARAPERQQLGLVLLAPGVMRPRQRVRAKGGGGEVTSGGFSPTLGRSIALARVPRETVPGEAAEVEVRGRWLPARFVRPPFVRRGKVLVEIEP